MDFLKLLKKEKENLKNKKRLDKDKEKEFADDDKLIKDVSNFSILNVDIINEELNDYLNMNSICKSINLIDYKLDNCINNLYYIPNFINLIQENYLLKLINQYEWIPINSRKLQCYGGNVGLNIENNQVTLPLWLNYIIDYLIFNNIFDETNKPNHVLINSYSYIEGIIHHLDGPRYIPRVAILSLSSSCLMSFQKNIKSCDIGITEENEDNDMNQSFNILLEEASLIVFNEDLYTNWKHGIESNKDEEEIILDGNCPCMNNIITNTIQGQKIIRSDRISLTFRKAIWN
jgi:hypothetical protein